MYARVCLTLFLFSQDLSTLYGGDDSAASTLSVPWHTKEYAGRLIWETWTTLQSGLSYIFGKGEREAADGPDVYLANAAWHVRR